MVVYIEKDLIENIDNKVIIQWFQNIKTCIVKFLKIWVYTPEKNDFDVLGEKEKLTSGFFIRLK